MKLRDKIKRKSQIDDLGESQRNELLMELLLNSNETQKQCIALVKENKFLTQQVKKQASMISSIKHKIIALKYDQDRTQQQLQQLRKKS